MGIEWEERRREACEPKVVEVVKDVEVIEETP
jgi:hypothetical protein